MLHAIVKMQIRSRAQALVVKARQAQAFLQILFEVVEAFQLGCLRWHALATRSSPKHLVTGVHQQTDLIADHEACAIDMRPLARPVFDDRADSVTAHARVTLVQKIHGKSKTLQTLEALFESRLARRFSTEEHVTYYNARVPFLLSLDEGTTSARSALYDEQGRRVAMESSPIDCFYPHPGWVEQDANAIFTAQLDSARRVLKSAK